MQRYRLSVQLQLFAGEKTEKATPKKKSESRNKGQVAKSMEIPFPFIMLFIFLYFFLFGNWIKNQVFQLFSFTLQNQLLMEISISNVLSLFTKLLLQSLRFLAPIMIIAFITAILTNFAQFGLLFTVEPLKMNFKKLNPISGFKKIFGLNGLINLLKSIIKIIIIGAVIFFSFWGQRQSIIHLSALPLNQILSFVSGMTVSLGIKIAITFMVLAVLDYIYQKYDYEKNLRMSKQDIKDEHKNTEGDPLIKGKIKERQRRMAMQRMMQEVPKADVVITNPTHFAVAIQYDGGNMSAPVVLAKGADYVALKIKELAKENSIVMMENKPLARTLYDQVEIGEAIPPDLFQAVAEVLAYVYRIKGRTNG